MPTWLIKSDPDDYSAHDFAAEGTTLWDGVKNNAAQMHMREMKKNDRIYVYHSGKDKAVVATAKVTAAPKPDPADDTGKRVAVPMKFDRWIKEPVTLAQIKADKRFQNFALVRISRLSVMPVLDKEAVALDELIGTLSKSPPTTS